MGGVFERGGGVVGTVGLIIGDWLFLVAFVLLLSFAFLLLDLTTSNDLLSFLCFFRFRLLLLCYPLLLI